MKQCVYGMQTWFFLAYFCLRLIDITVEKAFAISSISRKQIISKKAIEPTVVIITKGFKLNVGQYYITKYKIVCGKFQTSFVFDIESNYKVRWR